MSLSKPAKAKREPQKPARDGKPKDESRVASKQRGSSAKRVAKSVKHTPPHLVTKCSIEAQSIQTAPPPQLLTNEELKMFEACENGDIDLVYYIATQRKININCRKPYFGTT